MKLLCFADKDRTLKLGGHFQTKMFIFCLNIKQLDLISWPNVHPTFAQMSKRYQHLKSRNCLGFTKVPE